VKAGRWLVATAIVGAGATLGIMPGASAQSSAFVRGVDGVLHEGCISVPFEYAIDPDKAAENWSLEVTAYDPAGTEVGSSWLWKDDGDAPAGTTAGRDDGIRVCRGAAVGRYRLTAALHFYLAPFEDEMLPESSFMVREPESRTGLVVNDPSPSVGERLRFRIRSRVEQPSGFVSNQHRKVALQKRTPAGWVEVGRVATDDRGVAVVEVRWRNRAMRAVRALTPRTAAHRRSLSAPIRIG